MATALRTLKTDAIDAAMIADLMRYKRYEPCALSERGAAKLGRATTRRLPKSSTMLKNRATAILERVFRGSFRPT
ncbi:MAG: transposase [Coriobacteriaceae bacterium]